MIDHTTYAIGQLVLIVIIAINSMVLSWGICKLEKSIKELRKDNE